MSDRTINRLRLWRDIDRLTSSFDNRSVDCGIELRTVRKDPSGIEAVRGCPKLVMTREPQRFGGIYDPVVGGFVGETRNPIVWYAGERQTDILLDRDVEKTRKLLFSCEGGGKTTTMAQWIVLLALEYAMQGHRGFAGAVAPTNERLKTLIQAIKGRVPIDSPLERRKGSFGTHFIAEKDIQFVFGITLQCRSAQSSSKASGSSLQGFNWMFAAADELQDLTHADPDIEARLRAAPGGVSRRMNTATAKDSHKWRTAKAVIAKSPDWSIERLAYTDTPFIHDRHWNVMRRNMSKREWERRGLANDVGPERQTYDFLRERNVRPIPEVGAIDITADVIKRGGRFALLAGHDPGQIINVSIFLRAFRIKGIKEPVWWVVDEVNSPRSTSEKHARDVLQLARTKYGLNKPPDKWGVPSNRLLIRCDPWGQSDNKPDQSIYKTFKREGLDMLSSSYKKGKGDGRVHRDARIEMVNRLLHNADGVTRLYIDCDSQGRPVAPKLVECFETQERDLYGRAETQRKDENDTTHWGSAVGHGLYPYEKVRTPGKPWTTASELRAQ